MSKWIITMAMLGLSMFPAAAQSVHDDYNTVGVSYVTRGYGGGSTNGFEVGYVHGFSVWQAQPLYFQTGLKMDMGFKDLGNEGFDEISINADFTTMSFSVPIDLAYRFGSGDNGVYFTPYIGLNMKLNAMAKAKASASAGGAKYEESISLFDDDYGMKHFQIGWHIGAGVDLTHFHIGAQFGTDFMPIIDGGNHTPTFSIGVGYTF